MRECCYAPKRRIKHKNLAYQPPECAASHWPEDQRGKNGGSKAEDCRHLQSLNPFIYFIFCSAHFVCSSPDHALADRDVGAMILFRYRATSDPIVS